MTELLLFDNMLESLPASLFEMSSLEMLNVDRNHLMEIPSTVRINTFPEKGVNIYIDRVHNITQYNVMYITLYNGT